MVRPVEIGLDLLDLGGINNLSNVSAYRVFFPVSVRRFSHSVYLKSEVCVSLKKLENMLRFDEFSFPC